MARRVGQGYDIHKLVEGRKLILGGVEIPYEKGLLGHSDADVLLHAVIDALFGAAGLPDIGQHFPDTDPHYKNTSSGELLAKAHMLIGRAGFRVVNLDSTIIAQAPKLAPHIQTIRKSLADALGVSLDVANVKAKTNEGLDAIGRGEAIAAHAIVLLRSTD